VILSFVPLSLANAIDFTAWTDSASNPLFGGSTSGVNRAYYPSAIKVGSVYHIWYGDGANTRHALSANFDFNGVSFFAPVVTGLAATNPYHPRVLYNASGWNIGGNYYAGPFLMYYTDGNAWTSSPRVAHSADGNSWTDLGPCTGVNSYSPNTTIYNLDVLYEGGTIWKAYADNGLGHIEYYVSTDGLNWTGTAHNILGSLQPWETSFTSPHVIKSGSQYIVYYGSGLVNNQGIGVAFSTDGQNFTKSSSNPIFSISDVTLNPWRNDRTYTPFVIPNGASWIMYYTGRSSLTGNYSIGYALPSTPSGTNVTVTFPEGGSVTFSNVNAECFTTLTEITNPTHSPPPNFNFIRYGYFDISTDCSYTGPVTVVYPYDESEITGQEQNLKLLHWNSGGWEDCTVSVDTVNNTISGQVDTLSPFGIGYYYSSGGGGYSTGANENMIALIAILAISAGLFILRRNRWIKA
jgi:hypothetical protein